MTYKELFSKMEIICLLVWVGTVVLRIYLKEI